MKHIFFKPTLEVSRQVS